MSNNNNARMLNIYMLKLYNKKQCRLERMGVFVARNVQKLMEMCNREKFSESCNNRFSSLPIDE